MFFFTQIIDVAGGIIFLNILIETVLETQWQNCLSRNKYDNEHLKLSTWKKFGIERI